MAKSIYCVYWRWFDANGNELPRKCATHSWFSSYRKARAQFESEKEILYSHYNTERIIKQDTPASGWSPDDGTYELEAVKIYARKSELEHLRLVLAATNLN